VADGDASTLSVLNISLHCGTHVDAPLHFIKDGRTIDQVPLDAVLGPCRVVDCGDADWITEDLVRSFDLHEGERVLFKTRNSGLWGDPQFCETAAGFDRHGARAVRDAGLRLVGIDYLSVGSYRKWGIEVHHAILGADIPIIESINLTGVEPGDYELFCAPLLVPGAEAAPARVLIRPLS
jgi:arylformamidase